jgi:hypothetical protein
VPYVKGNAQSLKIMSLDPGGTTGWCIHLLSKLREGNGSARSTSGVSYDYNARWRGGQIGPDEHHLELYRFMLQEQPDVVVCEAFNYQIHGQNDGTKMPGIRLISREYIGIAKLYCAAVKHPFVLQQPSVKSIAWCKDTALKKMGLHTPGKPHQNDAARHMVHYLVQTAKRTEILNVLR